MSMINWFIFFQNFVRSFSGPPGKFYPDPALAVALDTLESLEIDLQNDKAFFRTIHQVNTVFEKQTSSVFKWSETVCSSNGPLFKPYLE